MRPGPSDGDRPATRIRTLSTIGDEATARPRFRAVLIGTFAILALVLAMVGVFGVLAVVISKVTAEEALLTATLPGYQAYQRQTKRFVPFLI